MVRAAPVVFRPCSILFPEVLMTMRSWIRNVFARPATRPIRKVPHRTRLTVEVLEDRTVPSVSVTGVGTLTITDSDTSGHTINVNQTATQGTFTVQVDGGSLMTFTGINNINANLGADSDTLSFNNPSSATTNLSGSLSVTAADGNNSVSEAFYAIGGSVSLTEGNGSDLRKCPAPPSPATWP
jgi:hypothetical protein